MESVHSDRRAIARRLHLRGLREPVLIVPPPLELRELRAVLERPHSDVRRAGRQTWKVRSGSTATWYKVQRKIRDERDFWTCSCADFVKHRGGLCKHIKRVQHTLEEPTPLQSAPYANGRRRPARFIIYPQGEPTQATRKARAYDAMPSRAREMISDLCRLLVEPPPRVGAGAPILPLRVCVYALLLKVAFNYSYAELRGALADDENLGVLGWTRHRPPSKNSLCTWFADPTLPALLLDTLQRTASVGRRIDEIVAVDSSGLSTAQATNWRDFKLDNERKVSKGERTLRKGDRPGNQWVKPHAIMGTDTGLVYWVVVTLSEGEGTADVVQFFELLMRAAQVGNFKHALADKAYGSAENFTFAESIGIQLLCPPKVDSDPRDAAEPVLSQLHSYDLFHDFPEAFYAFYGFRSKIENIFSSVQRKTGRYVRLRRRKTDPHRAYPPKPARRLPKLEEVNRRARVREIAQSLVGHARTSEVIAKFIAYNLRRLVRLEHDYNDRVNFAVNKAFPRMKCCRAIDVA